MCEAYLETRQQHTKGSWPRQGPDTYVSVQVVPDGVERLIVLNRRTAAIRGIKLIYCGQGYQDRCKTDRSTLGAAIVKAQHIVNIINDNADLIDSLLEDVSC